VPDQLVPVMSACGSVRDSELTLPIGFTSDGRPSAVRRVGAPTDRSDRSVRVRPPEHAIIPRVIGELPRSGRGAGAQSAWMLPLFIGLAENLPADWGHPDNRGRESDRKHHRRAGRQGRGEQQRT
jgi:hypothetical protein